MKKLLFIAVLILAPSFVIAQLDTGWINRGKYLEQSRKIGNITSVKFSNDKKYIYTYSNDNYIRKWDVTSGQLLHEKLCDGATAEINPETERVFIGYIKKMGKNSWYVKNIDFYNDSVYYKTKEIIGDSAYEIPYYCEYTTSIRIRFTNDLLGFVTAGYWFRNCAGSGSDVNGDIDLWDAETGEHFYPFQDHFTSQYNHNTGSLTDIGFSNDGQYTALSTSQSYISRWDDYWTDNYCFLLKDKANNYSLMKNVLGEEMKNINVTSLDFSWDSKYLAGILSGNSVYFWRTSDRISTKFWQAVNWPGEYTLEAIKFDKKTKYVITAGEVYNREKGRRFPVISIWDIRTGKVADSVEFSGYDYYWTLAVSPDGHTIATGSADGYLRIYNPQILSDTIHAGFYADSTAKPLGNPVLFYDVTSGEPTSWQWDFGDGASSFQQNPSHQYKNPGCYTVRLISSDGIKTDTLIRNDYINITKPVVAAFRVEPASGPSPLTVKFHDESLGDIVSWKWDFGDGTTSEEQNPEHTFIDPKKYNISLDITDGFLKSSITKEQLINVDYKIIDNIEVVNEKEYYYQDFDNVANSAVECYNDGYFIGAKTEKYIKISDDYYQHFGPYIYLLRLNENIDTIRTTIIDNNPFAELLTQTTDSNYCLIGSGHKLASDYYIMKIDDSANVLWSDCYGTIADDDYYYLTSTPDGGCIAIGHTYYDGGPILLMKVKKNGQYCWYRTYNRTNNYSLLIHGTNDDGFIVFAFDSNGDFIEIVKHNFSGPIEWTKTLYIDYHLSLKKLIQLKDDSYILAGSEINGTPCGHVIRFDKYGNILWDYSDPHKASYFYSITQVNDSVFAVSGNLDLKIGFQLIDINGNFLEEYLFEQRRGYISSIILTKDKCLLLVGTIVPIDKKSRIYVLKTKLDKRYVSDVDTSVNEGKIKNTKFNLSIIPNPFSQTTKISFELEKETKVRLTIYNVLGQEIATLINGNKSACKNEVVFDRKGLPIGMYYCVINIGGDVGTYPMLLSE